MAFEPALAIVMWTERFPSIDGGLRPRLGDEAVLGCRDGQHAEPPQRKVCRKLFRATLTPRDRHHLCKLLAIGVFGILGAEATGEQILVGQDVPKSCLGQAAYIG